MLTEAELQKKWENLTFTDDFIFSRVMHDENICRQVVELILGVRIGKIFPGVLRGGSGFAGAQPRLTKIAQYIAIFRLKPSLPTYAVLGSRSEHNSAKLLAKDGVLGEGKPRCPVEGCPSPNKQIIKTK